MRNEKIVIKRDSWESLREYRKAPFKKRYIELGELSASIDFVKEYQ